MTRSNWQAHHEGRSNGSRAGEETEGSSGPSFSGAARLPQTQRAPVLQASAPRRLAYRWIEGLELRRDIVEGRCEAASDKLHCADRGNGDQGGDQAVFDRGRPILASPEFFQCSKDLSRPVVVVLPFIMPTKACQSLNSGPVPVLRCVAF